MLKKLAIAIAVTLSSTSAFSASFTISPHSQETHRTCAIDVSASNLVDVRGIDLEITFDKNIVACASAQIIKNALPGFAEFYRKIDNEAGSLEIVLLRQAAGGYSGQANSFLVLSFEEVSSGAAHIRIRESRRSSSPLLIDHVGTGIEAEVDTAVVNAGSMPAFTVARVYQNYPNPFNPFTTILFDVPSRSPVSLKIFDVSGRLVRVLINGKEYGVGRWEQKWDGTNEGGVRVQSGVYLCVYEACGRRSSTKLVILR